MNSGRKSGHWRISILDVADGEYMLQKMEGKQPGIARIEKQFGLKPGQLASYRANNYSRKRQNGK